jgi:hypothetical protein
MNELISPCQSTFIKRRNIHDNFLYIRNLYEMIPPNQNPRFAAQIGHLQGFRLRTLGLPHLAHAMPRLPFKVVKLDHCPANNVHLSGNAKWHLPRPNFTRQRTKVGGPVSPLLFILAIDPLHRLLQLATD